MYALLRYYVKLRICSDLPILLYKSNCSKVNFVSYNYNSMAITSKCLYASSVAKEFQNNCGNYTTYKQNFQGRQLIITYVYRKGLATWDYCICTNFEICKFWGYHKSSYFMIELLQPITGEFWVFLSSVLVCYTCRYHVLMYSIKHWL